jgi:hypothetical protein
MVEAQKIQGKPLTNDFGILIEDFNLHETTEED